MKFPEILGSLFSKKSDGTQVYLSLYLDVHSVAVAFWSMQADGVYKMLAEQSATVAEDSWDARCEEVDRLIGFLEEKTGHTEVTKAILGLPTTYLTPTGEILKDVRSEIKELTKALELTPIGFVPLHQAVIYKMKKDEGVPPSVILLGINSHAVAVTMYKIGSLVGIRDVEKHDDIASSVETGLRSFTDLEVLPARMLLYGSNASELEEIKAKLLRHQWTTKVNFLHFPKIEIISPSLIIESVSLAGASELGMAVTDDEEVPDSKPAVEVPVKTEDVPMAKRASPQEETGEEVADVDEEEEEPEPHVAFADGTIAAGENHEDLVTEEVAEAQEAIAEDFAVDEATAHADANVVMVDAESLGFKKDVDVLEETSQLGETGSIGEEDEEEYEDEVSGKGRFSFPKLNVSALAGLLGKLPFKPSGGPIPLIILLGVVVLVIGGLLYWLLPHATVNVLEIPKIIESSETITIDPTATIVDAQNKIVPGKKREKSVSGEKTVPVNGKKSIGDPAKGTVTIYNKSLSSRTFKKGMILTNGSLQFTLDGDVEVASASENVGSITFGKADANVTAIAIGTSSNLAGGGEFTFKDLSSTTAIARNDKAFAGGNSRDVTVVTRADYDAFVKDQSDALVGQAKQDLASSVGGGEKLIDSTIKTTVTEKVFVQELDQESKELSGKLTLTVSGIAYSETDIRALLTTVSSDKIPAGYAVSEDKTTVTVSDITVKKDGKMTAKATMKATALPILSTITIKHAIAGKSLKFVEDYLRAISGVGGVEVSFRLSPTKSRLPANGANITVSISVAQ